VLEAEARDVIVDVFTGRDVEVTLVGTAEQMLENQSNVNRKRTH
jgi:hypothetical protein